MKISTKGRYALRVMLDLAQHNTGEYITLADVAKRQDISEKYLEGIIVILSRKKFVLALRGKGGGYKLARDPQSYSVASILKLVEGSLAPVACLEDKVNSCPRAGECITLPLWKGFYKMIDDYFEGITLTDLLGRNSADNYSI